MINITIDARAEVDRLRLAIADDADRSASARRRDLQRVQEHEGRITMLERLMRGPNGPQAAE